MAGAVGQFAFFFALIVVIVIHEAAHFGMAKWFGIKVQEFFVGFGPRIWSTRRGETEYGFKWIPAGGYVKIAGMNPYETLAPEDEPRTFGAKPIWQRALVIVAGPATHFILAFFFFAEDEQRRLPTALGVVSHAQVQPRAALVAFAQSGVGIEEHR